jgi:hypothetical protein
VQEMRYLRLPFMVNNGLLVAYALNASAGT